MKRAWQVMVAVGLGTACTQAQQQQQQRQPVTNITLAAPAPGEGFQYDVPAFEVAPGTDQQNCYFYQIPGAVDEPVYVNKFVIAQNDGTHHMNIFRVKTIIDLGPEGGQMQTSTNGQGPCFNSSNWADWPLVVNSQVGGNTEWELPSGVAHVFHGGEWIMLQSHYVNATTQATPSHAKVYVNFYTTNAANVQHELGTLFATKQSIRVCEHDAVSRFNGTCQFNSDVPITIVGANGHFHSRGVRFDMYSWDGMSITRPQVDACFYTSLDWSDPPMKRSPELQLEVPAHGGIWYTCEFEWRPPPPSMGCDGLNAKDAQQLGTPPEAQDCCYTFGGPVDWAEHCNVFAYYYPKTENINCF